MKTITIEINDEMSSFLDDAASLIGQSREFAAAQLLAAAKKRTQSNVGAAVHESLESIAPALIDSLRKRLGL